MSEQSHIPVHLAVVAATEAAINASTLPPALKEHLLKPSNVQTGGDRAEDSKLFVRLFFIVIANGGFTVHGWGSISHHNGWQRGLYQQDALFLLYHAGVVDGILSTVASPLTQPTAFMALLEQVHKVIDVFFETTVALEKAADEAKAAETDKLLLTESLHESTPEGTAP